MTWAFVISEPHNDLDHMVTTDDVVKINIGRLEPARIHLSGTTGLPVEAASAGSCPWELTRSDGHPGSGVEPRGGCPAWLARRVGRGRVRGFRSRRSSRPRSWSCASVGSRWSDRRHRAGQRRRGRRAGGCRACPRRRGCPTVHRRRPRRSRCGISGCVLLLTAHASTQATSAGACTLSGARSATSRAPSADVAAGDP